MLVVVVPEQYTMEVVCSRLGDDVHRSRACHPFLGIITVCGDSHFLNALERRDVKSGSAGFPKKNALRPVNAGRVECWIEAIDRNRDGSLRCIGNRPREPVIVHRSRSKEDEGLKVSIQPGG